MIYRNKKFCVFLCRHIIALPATLKQNFKHVKTGSYVTFKPSEFMWGYGETFWSF